MSATVYSKSPNYSSLVPAIKDSLARPRVVPLFTWSPSWGARAPGGTIKALPSYELYQLHGAHLFVATLRVRDSNFRL